MTAERGKRKVRTGLVTSDKMDKTITVNITRTMSHPLYGKIIRKHSKLMAHDEQGEAKVGDLVEVMETRPLSRKKRWRLTRIVEKSR